MPIEVELQGQKGEVIETLPDFQDVLRRTLPTYDDSSFQLLSKINWYGDMEFESGQMTAFLTELERIFPKATSTHELEYLDQLKRIATRCAATPGCSLKFFGD
jgi:hypothetical protein